MTQTTPSNSLDASRAFMVSHESSDDELIAYCLSGPASRIIGGAPHGNHVVKISEKAVIKYGMGVSEDEAVNQQRVYDLVDHNIVRVPRVHRFFMDNLGHGFIMMDYIEGKEIDPLVEPHHIQKLIRVLDHFSTLKSDAPGSLSGGPSRGLLWPETEDLTFNSVSQMEAWFNSRLLPGEGKLSFRNCDLVLCHLDIAPRNIIWQPDGAICLIDWASAGFYPRLFEFWAQWNIEGKDGPFNKLLLDSMRPLPDYEMEQKWRICRVWYNLQKYSFSKRPRPSWYRPTERGAKRITVPGPPVPPPPFSGRIESIEPLQAPLLMGDVVYVE